MKRYYLDYNAGAPLRRNVRRYLAQLLDDGVEGNPSSIHLEGQAARRILEHARTEVARLVGAQARQIIFTSGGTEANNLAVYGAAAASGKRRVLLSSAIEHSSLLAPLSLLEKWGFRLRLIEPQSDGRLDIERIAAAIDDTVALVTLGLVNAETGAIQDLAPLAPVARERGVRFHVDAAQALGKIPVSVEALGCDLMTLSGHKIGAPAGVGALYVRAPETLEVLLRGGAQEHGLRAGSQNLLGVAGFGCAAKSVYEQLDEEIRATERLTATLLGHLSAKIPQLRLNGPAKERVGNTLNLTFPGVEGESMLIALDLAGVAVSMGSACAAGSVEPSHVLLAMGLSPEAARSSLRLSVGPELREEEVVEAADIIVDVWKRLAAGSQARRLAS